MNQGSWYKLTKVGFIVIIAAAAFTYFLVGWVDTTVAGGTPFGAPVKVTPELGYGYEPSVLTDKFGNIFAAAHKENWQLAVAPDINSPTYTRSMSWIWL